MRYHHADQFFAPILRDFYNPHRHLRRSLGGVLATSEEAHWITSADHSLNGVGALSVL